MIKTHDFNNLHNQEVFAAIASNDAHICSSLVEVPSQYNDAAKRHLAYTFFPNLCCFPVNF
ncbi:hypothetical protein [Nostoc sp. CCY 9925]|uniref:hypothetical protein n=1 Tax=Nostoc sp. CCY 9925 TaxID=3103865 RepID=UPI0039C67274